jgi:hypothetical protein
MTLVGASSGSIGAAPGGTMTTVGPSGPPPVPGGEAVARSAAVSPSPPLSNAATDGWTVRPAVIARARADASAAMISIDLPRSVASRARSRKLMRDVARREPYGRTIAIRSSSESRIRAAADVISSSASRYRTAIRSASP